MIKVPIPKDEEERLESLYSYQILDTEEEKKFDEITKATATFLDADMAFIFFVDRYRQWFKSSYGIDIKEGPRDISICGHAIMSNDIFIVQNLKEDKRFHDNPYVTDLDLNSYIGVPLVSDRDKVIGTLFILNSKKDHITSNEQLILKTLSNQVMSYLILKKEHIELTENKLLIEKLLNNMHEGMVLHAPDGKVIQFNHSALDVLSVTEDQLLGNTSFDPRWESIHLDGTPYKGEDHPAMVTLRTGKKVQNEIMGIYEPKKGKRWIMINSIPLELESGRHAIVTFLDISKTMFTAAKLNAYGAGLNQHAIIARTDRHDITDQKEFKAHLQETIEERNRSLNFLKGVQDNAALAIISFDLNGIITSFNKKAEEMLAYKSREVVGLQTTSIFHDTEEVINKSKVFSQEIGIDIKPGNDTFIIHANLGLKHEYEWTFISKDGQRLPVLLSITAIKDEDNNINGYISMAQDITDIKKAQEQKLKELNDILANTPSCLKIVNKDGELLEMNKQGLDLIEAPNLESVLKANVFDIVEESHREKFIEFNKKVCEGKSGTLVFEIIGLNGTRRWMETYAAPYKQVNGEICHIAITNDITDKINHEREYEKQKAFTQHQAKLASIGELAAGVGHEINNPLTIAKGFLNNLEKNLKTDLSEENKDYIRKINTSIDRIARIVKGLRTFSRTEELQEEYHNPYQIITDTVDLLKQIYANDGIKIRLDLDEINGSIYIRGDQGKFQQVLINLLTNSKDAVKNQDKKDIIIKSQINKNQLTLKIIDTGKGIPESYKERIFYPFFTTKDVNEGTGIGLSISHNYVKELGGSILLDNNTKDGTCFLLSLPIEYNTKTTSNTYQDEVNSSESFNVNIILADDEEGIRDLLAYILEDMGINVTTVNNGEEAYKLYSKSPNDYDLILSDIKMPVMDGPKLLYKIRENKSLKQPKFVFITGGVNIDFEDRRNEINKLIDGYLLKPFSGEDIQKLLQNCLGSKFKTKIA